MRHAGGDGKALDSYGQTPFDKAEERGIFEDTQAYWALWAAR